MEHLPAESIRMAFNATALLGLEILMLSESCPRCGANLALVGRAHRCVPARPRDSLAEGMANVSQPKSATYRYRDPDARRAYMADYMRSYRARKAVERQAAAG
jgi:hypothetical protein